MRLPALVLLARAPMSAEMPMLRLLLPAFAARIAQSRCAAGVVLPTAAASSAPARREATP